MALTLAEILSQAWHGVNTRGMTIVKDGHATEEEAEELPNKYNPGSSGIVSNPP